MGEGYGKVVVTDDALHTIQTQLDAWVQMLQAVQASLAQAEPALDPGLAVFGKTPDGQRALTMARGVLVDGSPNYKQELANAVDAAVKLQEIAKSGFKDVGDQEEENLLGVMKTVEKYAPFDLKKGAA